MKKIKLKDVKDAEKDIKTTKFQQILFWKAKKNDGKKYKASAH